MAVLLTTARASDLYCLYRVFETLLHVTWANTCDMGAVQESAQLQTFKSEVEDPQCLEISSKASGGQLPEDSHVDRTCAPTHWDPFYKNL